MPKITHIIPGETYLVRQWEDMEAEYGLTPRGSINCPGQLREDGDDLTPRRVTKCTAVFTTPMKYLCGTLLTAPQELLPHGEFVHPRKSDPDDFWYLWPEMLEPAPQNDNGDD